MEYSIAALRATAAIVAFLGLASAFLGTNCQPPAPAHGPTDADDGAVVVVEAGDGTCASACSNLAALGCAEGAPDAGCLGACSHARGLFDMRVACLSGATSREAARACGTVRCP